MARKKKVTLKDQVSNYAGLVIALAGAVGGLTMMMEIPGWITKAAIVAGTLAGAVIAWLTGKDGEGKAKPINSYKP